MKGAVSAERYQAALPSSSRSTAAIASIMRSAASMIACATSNDTPSRFTTIIGNRFHFVSVGKEPGERGIEPLLGLCKPCEDTAHAAMCLGKASSPRLHEGFRGMIGGNVGLARGNACEIKPDDGLCRRQMITRGGQFALGFRRQMSTPSRRSSAIRLVRSRYAPAGNGLAEMTAPVCSRISVVMAPSG